MISIHEISKEEENLNEKIAIKLMGWKWMKFKGVPVKGTLGYPNKCMVRQLLAPEMLLNPQWQDYFKDNEGGEADGTEALDYCYCSSHGPTLPPFYSSNFGDCELVEGKIESLGLSENFQEALKLVEKTEKEKLRPYKVTCRQICEAALIAVDV